MYIVCNWIYVYGTVAVEFKGCYVGVVWSWRVKVHTMYNIYKYCMVAGCKGSLCKVLKVTEPWSLQSLYQGGVLWPNECELAVTGVGRHLFSV